MAGFRGDPYVQSLELDHIKDLIRLHAEGVDALIAKRSFNREALWSDSLAVGSQQYVEKIKKDLWRRTRFDEECVTQDDQSQTWVVREAHDAYVADSGQKPAL